MISDRIATTTVRQSSVCTYRCHIKSLASQNMFLRRVQSNTYNICYSFRSLGKYYKLCKITFCACLKE